MKCRRPQFNSWAGKIHQRRDGLPMPGFLGFPGGSDGKKSAGNVGDLGSVPGLGRSRGEGKGYPLEYSGLENSMDFIVHSQIWPWSTKWSRAKANRVLPREHTSHSKHLHSTTQEKTTQGQHQMVDTKIRLIIFFTAKDGEALYSQQKQDWELTVAQIMNSLLQNSDWNWRKQGKPLDHSVTT